MPSVFPTLFRVRCRVLPSWSPTYIPTSVPSFDPNDVSDIQSIGLFPSYAPSFYRVIVQTANPTLFPDIKSQHYAMPSVWPTFSCHLCFKYILSKSAIPSGCLMATDIYSPHLFQAWIQRCFTFNPSVFRAMHHRFTRVIVQPLIQRYSRH